MKNCKLILKLSVLTSILLLAACGQKGPLYLEDGSTDSQNTTNTQTNELTPVTE